MYLHALETYRAHFDPDAASAQIEQPHTMVGVNLVVAETDEEAQRLFTTLQQMFLGVVTGQRQKIQPPRDITEVAPEHLLQKVDQTLSVKAVGSPATVVSQLEEIVAATKADELILTAYHYDPADRLRSLELLARPGGSETAAPRPLPCRPGSRHLVDMAPGRRGSHGRRETDARSGGPQGRARRASPRGTARRRTARALTGRARVSRAAARRLRPAGRRPPTVTSPTGCGTRPPSGTSGPISSCTPPSSSRSTSPCSRPWER